MLKDAGVGPKAKWNPDLNYLKDCVLVERHQEVEGLWIYGAETETAIRAGEAVWVPVPPPLQSLYREFVKRLRRKIQRCANNKTSVSLGIMADYERESAKYTLAALKHAQYLLDKKNVDITPSLAEDYPLRFLYDILLADRAGKSIHPQKSFAEHSFI